MEVWPWTICSTEDCLMEANIAAAAMIAIRATIGQRSPRTKAILVVKETSTVESPISDNRGHQCSGYP